MVPAHERLEAGQLVRSEPRDGLVKNGDLLPLQRFAEIALKRKLGLVLAAHGGIEDLDAVGAAALGPQHGSSPSRSMSCAVSWLPSCTTMPIDAVRMISFA